MTELFETPLMRKLIILNCRKDDTRFTTYYGDFFQRLSIARSDSMENTTLVPLLLQKRTQQVTNYGPQTPAHDLGCAGPTSFTSRTTLSDQPSLYIQWSVRK